MYEGCTERPDTTCGNRVKLRYNLTTTSKKSDSSSYFTKPHRNHQGSKEGHLQVIVERHDAVHTSEAYCFYGRTEIPIGFTNCTIIWSFCL